MNALTVAPVQWSTLKNIDDVKPLNDGDTDCLVEIREVLKKYGKLDRFGVALLHSHFDLASDEIMLESADDDSRTLITKPVNQSDAGGINIGTIWMLREGDITTMSWCRKFCRQGNIFTGHTKAHNKQK
jgi:hypothetical protein